MPQTREERLLTFVDHVIEFEVIPGIGDDVIYDQVVTAKLIGRCEWCGDHILPGTTIRRIEFKNTQVFRYCSACATAMASSTSRSNHADTEAILKRKLLKR